MNKELPKKQRLSALQMLIMEFLWKHAELSTYDICKHCDQKAKKDMSFTGDYSSRDRSSASSGPSPLAIERELRVLKMRGLVASRGGKGQSIYQPVVTAEGVTLSVSDHLVNRLGANIVPKGLFDAAQASRPSARLHQSGDGRDE